jgi:hypothetical protein
VFYGDSRSGKSYAATTSAREKLNDGETVYYKSANNVYFGGYTNERVIIFDDFRGSWLPLSTLLQLLDPETPARVKVYGADVPWCAEHIYITSNVNPFNWYNQKQMEEYKALMLRFTTVTCFTGEYPDTEVHELSGRDFYEEQHTNFAYT